MSIGKAKYPQGGRSHGTMMPINEVAARLGVSVSFAHKLVRSGDLESYRFGRCRRVSEEQLQKYISGCAAEEPSKVVGRKLKYF